MLGSIYMTQIKHPHSGGFVFLVHQFLLHDVRLDDVAQVGADNLAAVCITLPALLPTVFWGQVRQVRDLSIDVVVRDRSQHPGSEKYA